jgi:hypothetical protein
MFSFFSCQKTETEPVFVNSSITGTYTGRFGTGWDATATVSKIDNTTFSLAINSQPLNKSYFFPSIRMTSANNFTINTSVLEYGSGNSYDYKGKGTIDGKKIDLTTTYDNYNNNKTYEMSFTGTK